MDVKDYCKGLEIEISAWKAKMYDLTRRFDSLGTEAKEKVRANVEDLHMVLADLEERVNQLRTECPSDWSPIKKDIDEAHIDMRSKYESADNAVGKGAPVSVPG
jgi:gamma-glutamyl:cysteine ligase YbdK (ATP-grasp superfamily)